MREGKQENIIVPVKPVIGIVLSQNCDAARSPYITLCEIRLFRDVEKKGKDAHTPKAFRNLITQQARLNQKWFYLPPDDQIGFADKMAADFITTIRMQRDDLLILRHQRKGRLNRTSMEHFRERVSEFFRRYAYDEWYPLNREELENYISEYPDTNPYPWQQNRR